MLEGADCILAMDFQNKAELLMLYPESREKIYMLSVYSEGPWQYREIPDPYLGDLETTRFCARQLRTCVRNLVRSMFHNLLTRENEKTADAGTVQRNQQSAYHPPAIWRKNGNLRSLTILEGVVRSVARPMAQEESKMFR
jgi:hypothetical protein